MFGDKKRLNLTMDGRKRWYSTLHVLIKLVSVSSEFNAKLKKHLGLAGNVTKDIFGMIKEMVDFSALFEGVSDWKSSER